jgi:hypothetical protein
MDKFSDNSKDVFVKMWLPGVLGSEKWECEGKYFSKATSSSAVNRHHPGEGIWARQARVPHVPGGREQTYPANRQAYFLSAFFAVHPPSHCKHLPSPLALF